MDVQRSDEELDRDWKPSGRRPQSTMARHFSVALDDLFKIDNSIADLDAAVDQKKRIVSTQTSELKALEEALKAADERLKATSLAAQQTPSPRSRKAVGADTFVRPQDDAALAFPTTDRPKTASRPNTARKPVSSPQSNRTLPPLPGARPPTPGASGSEDEEEK